jgi:RNA polymerase sigma-70 factor (ECF subfamily)
MVTFFPITMPAAPMALETDGGSSTSGEEERRWITASRDGDPDAFGQLVSLHQNRVFRLAGRFFRRREDVEDVAQETFLAAWDKLGSYREEAPFEHWLTRICLNQCYGRLRRQKVPEEPIPFDSEAPAPDPNARLEVTRLLSHLPAEDRFILLLLDGQGWSTQEIADRLGWSRTNVKVRAHRARSRLRRLLEKETVS